MKKYINIFILAILMVWSGCSRDFESDNMLYELPDEPPIPSNLSIFHLADGIRISWEIEDTLDDISFMVYYSDSLEGGYDLWDSTAEFHSVVTSLKSGQYYYFRIAAITGEGLEGKQSEPMAAASGILSININNSDKFTRSRNVTARFIIPQAASLVKLSEDSTFQNVEWQSYQPAMTVSLSADEGMKYLYSMILFTDGSQSDSTNVIRDSIILDMNTSIINVYFSPVDSVFSAGDTVSFYLSSPEGEGTAHVFFPGISSVALEFAESTGTVSSWEYIYELAYVIPSGVEVIDGDVTGTFTDAAGNQAPNLSAATRINIANNPESVSLTAITESSSGIRLNWSRNADSDFMSYRIYRSTSLPLDNSGSAQTTINAQATTTYMDNGLQENTRYYYIIYIYDNTGRYTTSNIDSATTLANNSPDAVILDGRMQLQGEDTVITLNWSTNYNDDFASYRVFRASDSDIEMDKWILLATLYDRNGIQYTDMFPNPLEPFYQVVVYDRQGQMALSNWVEVTYK